MKVVLLHAFPLDETMWEPQRDALAGHDVFAPNLYALGGSSVDGWASAVLDRVDGDLTVVGASMGGYVGLALARAAPERVRGLLLAGARADADSPERRAAREATIAALRDEGVEAWGASAPFGVAPQSEDDFVRAVEALRDRRDSRDVVASYDRPLWMVIGADDELLSAEEAREQVAAAPNGRLDVVEGAGHIVSADRPDRFNAILGEFLEAASG